MDERKDVARSGSALTRRTVLRAAAASLLLPCLRGGAAPLRELVPQKPPRPAPPLELSDVDGRTRSLAAYRGRVVLVNFWATWCAPCVAEMPAMQLLQEKLGTGVLQILAVNYGESREKAADFAQRMDLDFPILLDAFHLARQDWKVRILPASYLVDGSGNIRYTALGEIDWTSAPVAETVRSLADPRKR